MFCGGSENYGSLDSIKQIKIKILQHQMSRILDFARSLEFYYTVIVSVFQLRGETFLFQIMRYAKVLYYFANIKY